jgi:hypothetical protein
MSIGRPLGQELLARILTIFDRMWWPLLYGTRRLKP